MTGHQMDLTPFTVLPSFSAHPPEAAELEGTLPSWHKVLAEGSWLGLARWMHATGTLLL